MPERLHLGRAGPFAPPRLPRLHHYYEPVRQRVPRRYSTPPVSAVRRSPYRYLQPEQATVSAPAFPRSAQMRQIGLTSPPCRTPPGQKMGPRQTHPGIGSMTPVSMPSSCFRHFISESLALVFPIPTWRAHGAPFPQRSPQRSSANAAWGGLKPPPNGRLRGATKPSSPAQHHIEQGLPTASLPHSPRSWRTEPTAPAPCQSSTT